MNQHLTEEQMSMCIVGRAAPDEERHGRECSLCREELERFREHLSKFQSVMHDWSNRQDVPEFSVALPSVKAQRGLVSTWSWAAVGVAVVILTAIPIHIEETALRQRAKAEEAAVLMDAVNLHLSRTMPAPMEPIMALIPSNEISTQTGGIQ